MDAPFETFGPKPGLMTMTNRDVFHVTWQGGGGYGDPLEREATAVELDVENGAVSEGAARDVYGVVIGDAAATAKLREEMRLARVGAFVTDEARFCRTKPCATLGPSLLVARDGRGVHVTTPAGFILSTGHSRWREGAHRTTMQQPPAAFAIKLHENLEATAWHCPATGLQLTLDLHLRGTDPVHDVEIDLEDLIASQSGQ